jgi:hypothetical protein
MTLIDASLGRGAVIASLSAIRRGRRGRRGSSPAAIACGVVHAAARTSRAAFRLQQFTDERKPVLLGAAA